VGERPRRQTHQRNLLPPALVPVASSKGPAMVSELTLHGLRQGRPSGVRRDHGVRLDAATLMTGLVVIGPEHLKTNYGGWPFTPDNDLAQPPDHRGASFQDAAGEAGHGRQGLRNRPRPSRLAQLFVPTLNANEPGCDDFHWPGRLRGSRVLRRSPTAATRRALRLEYV